jgi:outer membrane protein OmpA-like peptidoglycan-associated protein
MKKIDARTITLSVALSCMMLVQAFAQETTVKGMITGRTSDNMAIRTSDGTTSNVTLTDDTKVQSPKGLGLRKEQMSWAELIPGLKVNVKGTFDGSGNLVAKTITFSKNDLQTASMIQAGLVPTQERVSANEQNISANQQKISANQEAIANNAANVAANKAQIAANQKEVSERFSALTDYDVKNQVTVYFPTGRATLDDRDKAALKDLATQATGLTGYLIEVQGFADSTGNAAANQSLSRDRAYAVVNYLMQDGNVPPRHIVSPGAMGIANPAASNENTQGRAQNRRVEVKVMVNRGLAGSSSPSL